MINKKDSIMMKMPKFDVSLPCGRLHVRDGNKYYVFTKKATNIAVLAKLGRFPLYCDILIAVRYDMISHGYMITINIVI